MFNKLIEFVDKIRSDHLEMLIAQALKLDRLDFFNSLLDVCERKINPSVVLKEVAIYAVKKNRFDVFNRLFMKFSEFVSVTDFLSILELNLSTNYNHKFDRLIEYLKMKKCIKYNEGTSFVNLDKIGEEIADDIYYTVAGLLPEEEQLKKMMDVVQFIGLVSDAHLMNLFNRFDRYFDIEPDLSDLNFFDILIESILNRSDTISKDLYDKIYKYLKKSLNLELILKFINSPIMRLLQAR